MGRQIDSNFPVLEEVVVHRESLDERVSVFEIGVTETLQAASFRIPVSGKSDSFDLEFAEELDDVLLVDVVRQVRHVGGVRL